MRGMVCLFVCVCVCVCARARLGAHFVSDEFFSSASRIARAPSSPILQRQSSSVRRCRFWVARASESHIVTQMAD